MLNYQSIIDKYYAATPALREELLRHSSDVADLALSIAKEKQLPLDPEQVKAAAMLHDIGIVRTHAPSILCYGTEPYICHGIIGAEILRSEQAPEWAARVAERHTGAGLTAEEIAEQGLPLPHRDFLPETLLEKLICYADKFFSKSGDMQRKTLASVEKSMERFGASTAARFAALNELFK